MDFNLVFWISIILLEFVGYAGLILIPFWVRKQRIKAEVKKNSRSSYGRVWCVHHACATRWVGRPGSNEERLQCDFCEAEWLKSLDRLLSTEGVA